MKTLNIEQLSILLSNKIAAKNAELYSYEMLDNNNDNPISNNVKEDSYLAGFFHARRILFDYFVSNEKYVEVGGEYTLDVGSLAPIKVKVLKILNNYVECKYLSSYNGRVENIGFELFKNNGYKFK